jgi:hypothetical protein
VVVGQSQGGGAAITTARYATEFGGPGLDYRGAVGTGVPAYIEDVLQYLGPKVPPVPVPKNLTVYALYIVSGLRTSFPEYDIDSHLTESGRQWVDRAEQLCDPELAEAVAAQHVNLGDLFSTPLSAIPNFHAVLRDYMGIPERGYDRPLFIGQGLLDTDVSTPGVLTLAATLQANRQPLTFRTYPTDHNGTVNASLVDTVGFVAALLR